MDMRLDAVVLRVADVDRAKDFYRALGFVEDFDFAAGADFRVVRFTPPGSSAAVVFGTGISSAPPGSVAGLVLAVSDIEAARDMLVARGLEVGDVFHDAGGVFYHDSEFWDVPGRDPARRDRSTFARFADPDGNGWVLAEVDPAGNRGGNGHRR